MPQSTKLVLQSATNELPQSPYDIVWDSVFKKKDWANEAYENSANIVLFGADLDKLSIPRKQKRRQTRRQTRSSARPHIALAIWDRSGDVRWQKNFRESLRGTYGNSSMSELEELDLTVGSFTVPEIDAGVGRPCTIVRVNNNNEVLL